MQVAALKSARTIWCQFNTFIPWQRETNRQAKKSTVRNLTEAIFVIKAGNVFAEHYIVFTQTKCQMQTEAADVVRNRFLLHQSDQREPPRQQQDACKQTTASQVEERRSETAFRWWCQMESVKCYLCKICEVKKQKRDHGWENWALTHQESQRKPVHEMRKGEERLRPDCTSHLFPLKLQRTVSLVP